MARSIAISRSVSPRSLRELRIAARSTPAADVSDDAPRLRFRLDQRCRSLGVALTEDWRTLARIFDETDAPRSTKEIWTRARALGLKASRSHVYQLINNLLALDVLIVAEAGRTLRYATPLAVRMILRTQGGQAPVAIEDPLAIEALAAALLRAGRQLEGRDIEIELIDSIATSSLATSGASEDPR